MEREEADGVGEDAQRTVEITDTMAKPQRMVILPLTVRHFSVKLQLKSE